LQFALDRQDRRLPARHCPRQSLIASLSARFGRRTLLPFGTAHRRMLRDAESFGSAVPFAVIRSLSARSGSVPAPRGIGSMQISASTVGIDPPTRHQRGKAGDRILGAEH